MLQNAGERQVASLSHGSPYHTLHARVTRRQKTDTPAAEASRDRECLRAPRHSAPSYGRSADAGASDTGGISLHGSFVTRTYAYGTSLALFSNFRNVWDMDHPIRIGTRWYG